MSGIFFIVTIPDKKHEEDLRKIEKKSAIIVENDKDFKKPDGVKESLDFTKRLTNESYSISDYDHDTTKTKSTSTVLADEKALYKCASDAVQDIPKNTMSSVLFRSPWEDFKQVFKLKRNKLKITSGPGVNILSAFHWDTPLEVILTEILQRVNITNATWNSAMDKHFWQVTFMMESGNLCEELLQVLRTFGIGSKYNSSVCVIPCALYFRSEPKECDPSMERKSGISSFSSSVRARNNLEQIIHAVRSEATLTFDWLFLLIVAGFVAAIGLVENSTVILVASMLISPLMSPITASTLGTAVRDRSLQLMGVAHELLGLFLCLVIGFIFGLVICAVDEHYGVGDWPTYEILSRCEIRSLWVGVLVAIPSGAAVALAILGEYTSSLVGVAISASLLPPAVNAGLLWAMSLVHLVYNDDATRWTGVVKSPVYSDHQPTELAVLGAISLCLTLVNIICIFLAGVAVYKVKAVCPFERRNMTWWKDNRRLPHMRRYNNFDNWNTYSEWSSKNNTDTVEDRPKNNIQSGTVTYRRKQFDQNTRRTYNKTEIDTDLEDSSTIEISSITTARDYEKIDRHYLNQYMNQDTQANDNDITTDSLYESSRDTYDNMYIDINRKNAEMQNYEYPAIDRTKKIQNPKPFVVLDGRSFNV